MALTTFFLINRTYCNFSSHGLSCLIPIRSPCNKVQGIVTREHCYTIGCQFCCLYYSVNLNVWLFQQLWSFSRPFFIIIALVSLIARILSFVISTHLKVLWGHLSFAAPLLFLPRLFSPLVLPLCSLPQFPCRRSFFNCLIASIAEDAFFFVTPAFSIPVCPSCASCNTGVSSAITFCFLNFSRCLSSAFFLSPSVLPRVLAALANCLAFSLMPQGVTLCFLHKVSRAPESFVTASIASYTLFDSSSTFSCPMDLFPPYYLVRLLLPSLFSLSVRVLAL